MELGDPRSPPRVSKHLQGLCWITRLLGQGMAAGWTDGRKSDRTRPYILHSNGDWGPCSRGKRLVPCSVMMLHVSRFTVHKGPLHSLSDPGREDKEGLMPQQMRKLRKAQLSRHQAVSRAPMLLVSEPQEPQNCK